MARSEASSPPPLAPAALRADLPQALEAPTCVRRQVLWMTVAVYMITYMDRTVISTAAPVIQQDLHFSLQTMGWIFSAFQISYALFQIPGGWLGDRYGARRALTAVVIWWSIFTAATAAMWSGTSMFICRLLFGAGEAGSFPIATRALSRWMLPSERGWAQGITHAGSRVGGAFTPVLVAFLIGMFGWRVPFVLFALLGVAWAVFWHGWYRETPAEHPRVNATERALISSQISAVASSVGEPRATSVSAAGLWRCMLRSPQIWMLWVAYFCYAYSLGIFLTWFPKYLLDARGFNLEQMGLFASLPLLAGVLGDVLGGWASDRWLKITGNLRLARRAIASLGFALAGAIIPLATFAHDPLVSVACFSAAVFGLELTVGVSWAVTLDVGGGCAASLSAAMNTFGNTGGAIAAAGTAYLVSLGGWPLAFDVPAALSVLAALLFLRIDAARPLEGVPAAD